MGNWGYNPAYKRCNSTYASRHIVKNDEGVCNRPKKSAKYLASMKPFSGNAGKLDPWGFVCSWSNTIFSGEVLWDFTRWGSHGFTWYFNTKSILVSERQKRKRLIFMTFCRWLPSAMRWWPVWGWVYLGPLTMGCGWWRWPPFFRWIKLGHAGRKITWWKEFHQKKKIESSYVYGYFQK